MLVHVHMLISIPPKYSVSHIVGFLKGKTALCIANKYARKRCYKGYHFWARGFFMSTAGYDKQIVRRYIRIQENLQSFADLFSKTISIVSSAASCFRLPPVSCVIQKPRL